MEDEQRIALLIDCENASFRAIKGVFDELAKYGVTNIRRAYGNWKSLNLKGWEENLHPFAIQPIQQFTYTQGKNAIDAAMIIDAMDLLYTQSLHAFALMTSDSDFTPLVMRILTNGLKVYGFGERKTPLPFVNACSRFIYTENLLTWNCRHIANPAILRRMIFWRPGSTYKFPVICTPAEFFGE